MEKDKNINKSLTELLSKEKGLFGHVNTLGQKSTKYEFIGYELSEDFLPTLSKMSPEQKKNLSLIMLYFQIHAEPLKAILEVMESREWSKTIFNQMAWSHFMTIIMFGMLEHAVRISPFAQFDSKKKMKNKGESIKLFLESNLSNEIKNSIAERYSSESSSQEKMVFSSIIDELWEQIRCEFIHEVGLKMKGLEWHTLEGLGTKSNPIKIKTDVPIAEWLQITWQAILHSYGYKGLLNHPKYKKN